jgi:hypothetical protein
MAIQVAGFDALMKVRMQNLAHKTVCHLLIFLLGRGTELIAMFHKV